jgi:predicted metal-dependent HD superfamily phosphohydrolase
MASRDCIDRLKARWRTHVNAVGAFDAALTGAMFDRLCASYSESARHYHTLDHLDFLFDRLEEHGDGIEDGARVAFAAWYHDVIYDARRADNEEMSAARAEEELAELGVEAAMRKGVSDLVRATKDHLGAKVDGDGALFLDADYSILGAKADVYRAYTQNVRMEYAHVSDAQWRDGRGAFLKRAAQATRLFRTDVFERAYGAQAKANVAAELKELGVAANA